jgi:hypothetical protein
MGAAILEPELAPMRTAVQEAPLSSPGGRIGGGIDKILKHIIAERVLGLPADIRVDEDTAFKDEPTRRAAEALAERDGSGSGLDLDLDTCCRWTPPTEPNDRR